MDEKKLPVEPKGRGVATRKRCAETVRLSPLPCRQHLAEEAYRARIAELVHEIEETAAATRAESQILTVNGRGSP